MELSPRRFVLLLGLVVGVVLMLYRLFEAAGKSVEVAVAVAALALLVAVYLGTGLVMLRAARDPRARDLLQRRGYVPIFAMVATPLILIAAHPWGVATFAVGGGAMVACQLFLHAMIVVAAVRGRFNPRSARPPRG